MLNNLVSQPLPIPTWQMEPVSKQDSSLLNMQIDVTGPNQQKVLSDQVSSINFVDSNKPLLPAKRKAAIEPLSTSSLPSVAEKRAAKMEPNVNSPRSALNKRHTQVQSVPSKSGSPRVQTPKGRTTPQEVSPKVQSGSFEAVRSKMRETLVAALSVGSPNQEKASNDDNNNNNNNNNSPCEADAPPGSSVDIASESIQDSHQRGKSDGQEPQYNYVMPDADGSFGDTFFVKDELLQGNGLSWAWDMEVAELKDMGRNGDEKGQNEEDMPKSEQIDVNPNGISQIVKSPQELASEIEAELFKFFGGVNKKYKEKGRSLMFNLKDRNNPDLREKVLSGVISPERLCSMTPEELASKELSEWRMAKAEELDKMIVLPDAEVDIRRLVKKSHKGEYQVEVEQDDAVSVEVSVGSTSLTHFQPKKKKTAHVSSETHEVKEKEISEGDPASSLTIPADGTDFMQELIADEFKDEGFLPPIVSLDEFMESLNSEPPFENLPVDSKETKPLADKGNSETGSEKVTSELASVEPLGSEAGSTEQLKVKKTEAFLSVKTHEPPVERKSLPAASVVVGKRVWEGELQLTISSSVSVIGLFRSGEKTSTKEWPNSMEIKGRVRLDAFEKFLQELPMSRSRAVMVVHFILKDSSSELHRAYLSEALDSYVVDERLGFGEPNPGIELYFCPTHSRIIEMLTRHLNKHQTDILKPSDKGLIGVVVWRRPHISNINSPNSSSHHKHHRIHNNFPIRKHENINSTLKPPLQQPNNNNNNCNDDDDDDIPPGFGPGAASAAREEDDLPEFNFSGAGQKTQTQTQVGSGSSSGSRLTQSNPGRPPVDEMRKLIFRYGQTGTGTGAGQWNQDDDDDMPEWQPQLAGKHHRPPEVGLRPHAVNNLIRPVMGVRPPAPVMAMQPPVRWAVLPPPPPVGPHGPLPNAAVPGRHYGGQWRQDAPRSRGF